MLLEQKQKDEAYWEEYIQVKEEFVDQVLQVRGSFCSLRTDV